MSKKQKKIKKVKKATKATKVKPASKKAKPAKVAKKAKAKPARPVAGKTKAVKKSVKKIVKKKPTIKKVVKPVKKSAKKVDKKGKKIVKPLKKGNAKSPEKAIKKAAVKPLKKTANPEKPAKDIKVITLAKIAEKEKPIKKVAPEKAELFTEAKKTSKRKKKKQNSEDEDEPVIIEDILIEQLIQSTKRKAKQPKVPKILQTFVNPINSLSIAAPAGKKGAVKEPKGKFELEYVVRTSAGILYELLTTPSGLSEWFADDVNIRDGIFTFFWDGSEQKARLLGFKEDQYVRLQWIDKPEGSYFEFRIQKDELTGDISLLIIDFADEASDMETSKRLWDSQVNKLLNVLGSN